MLRQESNLELCRFADNYCQMSQDCWVHANCETIMYRYCNSRFDSDWWSCQSVDIAWEKWSILCLHLPITFENQVKWHHLKKKLFRYNFSWLQKKHRGYQFIVWFKFCMFPENHDALKQNITPAHRQTYRFTFQNRWGYCTENESKLRLCLANSAVGKFVSHIRSFIWGNIISKKKNDK